MFIYFWCAGLHALGGFGVGAGVGAGVALHTAAHAAFVCVPLGSTAHVTVVLLQLYIGAGGVGTGGAGVGFAVAVHDAVQAVSFVCVPLGSTAQSPVVWLQLYIGGGVGAKCRAVVACASDCASTATSATRHRTRIGERCRNDRQTHGWASWLEPWMRN